jgi:hypothetical protein
MLAFLTISTLRGDSQKTEARQASGSVEGRVICNEGGFPARGAIVSLTPLSQLLTDWDSQNPTPGGREGAQPAGTATDFDGYFVIPSVHPGIYVMHVRLAGYSQDFEVIQQVLNRFPPDRRKELLAEFPEVVVPGAGNVRKDVVIRRGASIGGRVGFDSGGVLDRAKVKAVLVSGSLIDGAVRGGAAKPASLWSAFGTTDDRGVYRIAGLPKGKYRIEVEVRETGIERGSGYLTVFAPEALTEEEAKPIAVDPGDELSDVDISIPLRLFHSVGGTVTRDGIPIAGASVTIQQRGQDWSRRFATGSNGTYRIDMLPQGSYVLEAEFPPAREETHGSSVKRKISVLLGDGDVLDANLDLRSRPSVD